MARSGCGGRFQTKKAQRRKVTKAQSRNKILAGASQAKPSLKKHRGRLITFEGIEGSGKSTHARLLAQEMRAEGHEVIEVREPGGTRLGEAIRLLLSKKGGAEKICAQAELLLFMASRAQLVEKIVLPALRRGEHVVCDRFSDSTAAYQGYARGCDLDLITKVNSFAVQKLVPDLTILLDLEPKTGFRRLHSRNRKNGTEKDRIESENMAFHKRVRKGYIALAGKTPGRFCVVNADRAVAEVQADIREAVWNVVE